MSHRPCLPTENEKKIRFFSYCSDCTFFFLSSEINSVKQQICGILMRQCEVENTYLHIVYGWNRSWYLIEWNGMSRIPYTLRLRITLNRWTRINSLKSTIKSVFLLVRIFISCLLPRNCTKCNRIAWSVQLIALWNILRLLIGKKYCEIKFKGTSIFRLDLQKWETKVNISKLFTADFRLPSHAIETQFHAMTCFYLNARQSSQRPKIISNPSHSHKKSQLKQI